MKRLPKERITVLQLNDMQKKIVELGEKDFLGKTYMQTHMKPHFKRNGCYQLVTNRDVVSWLEIEHAGSWLVYIINNEYFNTSLLGYHKRMERIENRETLAKLKELLPRLSGQRRKWISGFIYEQEILQQLINISRDTKRIKMRIFAQQGIKPKFSKPLPLP